VTTYQQQLTNGISEETLSAYWKAYFRENFRSLVHDQLLETFQHLKPKGLSKAMLARKLDRRPEQITRWLTAPNNLEIDTVSDLALAMGCVPKITFESLSDQKQSQAMHPFAEALDSLWILEANAGYLDSGSARTRGVAAGAVAYEPA
jgi:hypothetical protein